MKTKILISTAIVSSFFILPSAFAQGSLTPPGAPAPTMKSLDQVEPHTPVSSAPFTITNPGCYYLTTNLSVSTGNAITIATNGVTLDLNGFSIFSTAAGATGTAILLNGSLRNITIANGFIQGGVTNNGSGVYNGPGFAYGIYCSGLPVNVLVSRVSVLGCLDYGIFLNIGDSIDVESCTVRTVGSYGIYASTVKQSSAIDCGSSAIIGNQVSDCRGQSTSGVGVFATTALNCYGYSGSNYGVDANTTLNCYGASGSYDGLYAANCALNCYGTSSSFYGVYAAYIAIGCYGSSTSGTGLSAYIANSCYSSTGDSGITHPYNMP
jgi:hypothetical protein